MNFAYPTLFEQDEQDPRAWNVRIPGLDGSKEGPVTCGDDLDDARSMAVGLIDSWFYIHLKEGSPIPNPGPLPEGKGWELVRPSLKTQFSCTLRQLRAEAHLSQAEVAEKMGVKQPVYARLEDPTRANPTLKTVQAASRVFGVTFDLVSV